MRRIVFVAALLAACSESRIPVSGAKHAADATTARADARHDDDAASQATDGTVGDAQALDGGEAASDAGETADALVVLDAEPLLDGSPLDAEPTRDAGGMDARAGADALVLDASDASIGLDGGIDTTCDPSFGAANACGGNPVGTWVYASGCLDPAVFAPIIQACPGAALMNDVHSTAGALLLESNGTFSRTVHDRLEGDIEVPSSCSQLVGGCSAVSQSIGLIVPHATASCATKATNDCMCHVVVERTASGAGSYFVSGTTLSLAETGGGQTDYWYCVAGNAMRSRGQAPNTDENRVSHVLVR